MNQSLKISLINQSNYNRWVYFTVSFLKPRLYKTNILPSVTSSLGQTPPTQKTRSVAVCKCKLNKAECSDCNFGYLQAAQAGQVPLFIQIPIKMKKIAVCDCGEHRDNCSQCQAGYLRKILKGITPTFIEVEDDDKQETLPPTTGISLPFQFNFEIYSILYVRLSFFST